MHVSVRRTAAYADVSGVVIGPRASGQAVDGTPPAEREQG